MTASELKYLLSVKDLDESGCGVKMPSMAQKLNVSKVSVHKAVDRLSQCGYLLHEGHKVLLTEAGKQELDNYLPLIDFISDQILRHCDMPKESAFEEAVRIACAFGEISRNTISSYIRHRTTNNYAPM